MALPRNLTEDNTADEILPEQPAGRALRNLNFKVPPEFRKHFKDRCHSADVSHIELLRRALAAYDREQQRAGV